MHSLCPPPQVQKRGLKLFPEWYHNYAADCPGRSAGAVNVAGPSMGSLVFERKAVTSLRAVPAVQDARAPFGCQQWCSSLLGDRQRAQGRSGNYSNFWRADNLSWNCATFHNICRFRRRSDEFCFTPVLRRAPVTKMLPPVLHCFQWNRWDIQTEGLCHRRRGQSSERRPR
jgi:hypothetical protein